MSQSFPENFWQIESGEAGPSGSVVVQSAPGDPFCRVLEETCGVKGVAQK